jgi:hypothetical protein
MAITGLAILLIASTAQGNAAMFLNVYIISLRTLLLLSVPLLMVEILKLLNEKAYKVSLIVASLIYLLFTVSTIGGLIALAFKSVS